MKFLYSENLVSIRCKDGYHNGTLFLQKDNGRFACVDEFRSDGMIRSDHQRFLRPLDNSNRALHYFLKFPHVFSWALDEYMVVVAVHTDIIGRPTVACVTRERYLSAGLNVLQVVTTQKDWFEACFPYYAARQFRHKPFKRDTRSFELQFN